MGKVHFVNTDDRCGADRSLPLNVAQLNNLAGGGKTGEQKEGESPRHLILIRNAPTDICPDGLDKGVYFRVLLATLQRPHAAQPSTSPNRRWVAVTK
jgi:hypothetical protein